MPAVVDFHPWTPEEEGSPILSAGDSTILIHDDKMRIIYRIICWGDRTTIELCRAFAIQKVDGYFQVDLLDKPSPEPITTLTAENPIFVTYLFGTPRGKVTVTHQGPPS